jgi:hypothetical protein
MMSQAMAAPVQGPPAGRGSAPSGPPAGRGSAPSGPPARGGFGGMFGKLFG